MICWELTGRIPKIQRFGYAQFMIGSEWYEKETVYFQLSTSTEMTVE